MAVSSGLSEPTGSGRKPSPGPLLAAWMSRTETRPLETLSPTVTVIIPAFNNIASTTRCLQSIADTWFESLAVQIVVVDDSSTDATAEVLTALPGLDYVRNGANLGFIRACNRGAAIARGRYLCFLNNDTIVRPGWLDYLVTLAESDPTIAAVGSKLIYPDDTLQEAGSIIWRDGTGWNYGRGDDPRDSRYNYVRDADYCSGAALLVRQDVFRQLGGFSEEYVPAYYEDADLCFGIRSLGFRVVYQPRSEVVHYEGVTSGRDPKAGTKAFQEVNRPKFVEKWGKVLSEHLLGERAAVPLAARRLRRGSTILIVDSYVPMYDRDAGSARMMHIIRLLLAAGNNVIFLPDNYAPLQPYTKELQFLGVEVLHHIEGGRPMSAALDSVLPLVDFAWICRPQLFDKYERLIKKNADVTIIYDTIDLHFMRKRREAELLGTGDSDWRDYERMEIGAAQRADGTIVVTQSEKNVLSERGIGNIFVVPTIHDMEVRERRAFSGSSGILFIGGYNHPPNVDAARWLCEQIMPLVWKEEPAIILTLLGSNPPDSILAMECERVRVPGFVRDISTYFTTARLFAAPLRYGAGMNGKVGQALSFRLPLVLTETAADGFDLVDGQNCLIANETHSFADAILRLYRDETLWQKFSDAAAGVLEPLQGESVKPALLRVFGELRVRESRVPMPVGAQP